MKSFAVL